ncbi:hypothetical protein OESDEN_18822, partial [Oesophagostomum dentatum]
PGYPPNASQPPPNLILPPSLASQPPPNIQALLKSIPSLQTIQQASAAAAAAAAKSSLPPPAGMPPTIPQQRFGDVDERLKPSMSQPPPQVAAPIPSFHQMQQPPPNPMQQLIPNPMQQPPPNPLAPPAPSYQQQQPPVSQPPYAEEGPSHIEYKAGPGGDFEQHNGDGQYYPEGDKDGFYNRPPPFQNSGPFPPHNRGGPPRGGGFRGRGDQWRKS